MVSSSIPPATMLRGYTAWIYYAEQPPEWWYSLRDADSARFYQRLPMLWNPSCSNWRPLSPVSCGYSDWGRRNPSTESGRRCGIELLVLRRTGRTSFVLGDNRLPVALSLLLDLLVRALGGDPNQPSPVSVLLKLPIMIISIWLGSATWVKRWHDLNKSGWMVLLNLTIIAIPISLIVLGSVRGTTGANRYGGDPLSSQAK